MFISDIAIKRPVFTSMIILSLILFGWVSLHNLPLELFPKIELPVITITTPLKGADPETIETRVSDPIEGAVNTVSGIKKLQSTSMEGASIVMIEFQLEKNVDIAYTEVQQKVNSVRAQLPTDIDEPIVQKLSFDAAPVMTVVVSGDLSARDLYRTADKNIRERLQHVKNVGAINIIGGRDRKLWLWLDPLRLRQHNLTVRDVQTALARQHVEMPGGRIEDGRQELITRVKAEYQSADQLDNLILAESALGTVRLKDVGRTEDGLEEERSYAQRDTKPCITLEIQRQSGTNTVQVADGLKKELIKIADEQAKRGVKVDIAVDMSIYVKQSVNEVYHHLFVGGLLAVGTILIFLLNFRSTFISALVLPTSVMATFMMLSVAGFTINFMTLMALQLAIGLLIDDAIVVQENIMRHIEAGKPSRFAAAFATKEIGLAVLATTLSVVAVFMPTAFTKGIVGQFFLPFGMTVSFAVLISMLVSFTLDPMLSSRMLRKRTSHNAIFRTLEGGFAFLERMYERILNVAVRHRWLVIGTAVLVFVASMMVLKFAKSEFLPQEDRSEFTVNLRSPLGSSLATTRELMERVREQVRQLPEVEYTVYSIGGNTSGGAEGKVNVGSMYVRMIPKATRLEKKLRSQTQMMGYLRTELAVDKFKERNPDLASPLAVSVQIFDVMANSSGMKTSMLQLELLGQDLDKLDSISKQLLAKMREKKGFKDLDTTYEPGRPEISVYIDRDRAEDLGVSPLDIGDTIRAGIGGVNIGKFRAGKDRYDIAVRLLESGRDQPAKILDLMVPSSKSHEPIELRTIASIKPSSVPVEINRYNRQRQITVLANLEQGKVLSDAVEEVRGFIKDIGLPEGYSTAWSGQVEMQEESFGNLGLTMMLSIAVVFMVLAAQFESIIHPFTIMLSLPLAFVGAIVALVAFNQTINIMTMMAFIFLLGLVTKNAILLIDYANTLRHRDGFSVVDAIRRAGPVRLRPILMTTFAMIFGMLPSALGTGEGAESRQPMAIAIIGGLLSSTFLTLLVVPVVYLVLDPISEFLRRKVIDPEAAKISTDSPANELQPPPLPPKKVGVN